MLWEILYFCFFYFTWYWLPMRICHFHWLPYLCFAVAPYALFSLACRAHENGTRQWPWLRSLSLWRKMRAYFPLAEVYEHRANINEALHSSSCLFVAHPHGVFSWSTVFVFMLHGNSNPTLFDKKEVFVGVPRYLFYIPVVRDLILWAGAVDQEMLLDVIGWEDAKTARHGVILPGYKMERLICDSEGGQVTYVHNKKNCIIAGALEQKMAVVPVYCMGEDRLYRNLCAGRLKKFYENYWYRVADRPFPQLALGILGTPLPRRSSLQVCLGAPIKMYVKQGEGEDAAQMKRRAEEKANLFYTRFSELHAMYHTCSSLYYTEKNV